MSETVVLTARQVTTQAKVRSAYDIHTRQLSLSATCDHLMS